MNYQEKLQNIKQNTLFDLLNQENQLSISEKAVEFRFTAQDFRQLTEILKDFEMWGGKNLDQLWPQLAQEHKNLSGRQFKKKILNDIIGIILEKID